MPNEPKTTPPKTVPTVPAKPPSAPPVSPKPPPAPPPTTPAEPPVEPDHADAGKPTKESASAEADERRKKRAERRAKGAGTIPGNWFVSSGALVNMANVFHVTVPADDEKGDDKTGSQTVTITSLGGETVTLSGDDAADFLEQYQLAPGLPAGSGTSLNVNGQIVSPRDLAARDYPERHKPVPDRDGIAAPVALVPKPPGEPKKEPVAGKPDEGDEDKGDEGDDEGFPARPKGGVPTQTPAEKSAATRRANSDAANTGKPRR